MSNPLLGLIAGSLVGLITVGVMVTVDPLHRVDNSAGSPAPGAFLNDWRESRLASWAVTQHFDRTLNGKVVLSSTLRQAQDPPNAITVDSGSVNARKGDVLVTCAAVKNRQGSCTQTKASTTWTEDVDTETAILRGYLLGARPLYSVAIVSNHCYALRQTFPIADPPYGERAKFCFDAKTHAPMRVEIIRENGRDVTATIRMTGSPSDSDLAIPGVG